MLHAETSIGYEFGIVLFWIFAGFLAIGILNGILSIIGLLRDSDWLVFTASLAAIGLVVGLLGGGITTFSIWPPFSSQYHTYIPVSGLVQDVNSRFLSDGNSMSQRIAVTIRGQIYGCDDTRCAALRTGEAVTLLCAQEFETNGTPGYVCNWGKLGLNK
jgi:hypothetical protein